MKDLHEIKEERETKVSDLINTCGVFFAFSNEQFQESKTPLLEGEKYVSMGMGGYMPKGQLDNWLEGMKVIESWYKSELSDQELRRKNIDYELANHEAYYTGDIIPTLEALGNDYTEAEVREVYYSEYEKWSIIS